GAVAHAGNGNQRDVLAPVEGDVLPDLVADRDAVEFLAEPRQQLEVLARIDHRAGLSGLLNSTALVFGLKALRSISSDNRQCGGSSRSSLGMPPAWRMIGR